MDIIEGGTPFISQKRVRVSSVLANSSRPCVTCNTTFPLQLPHPLAKWWELGVPGVGLGGVSGLPLGLASDIGKVIRVSMACVNLRGHLYHIYGLRRDTVKKGIPTDTAAEP